MLFILLYKHALTISCDQNQNEIRKEVGISKHSYYNNWVIAQVIDNGLDCTKFNHKKKKKKKITHHIVHSCQEQCVLDFCHCDKSSSIDSNSK